MSSVTSSSTLLSQSLESYQTATVKNNTIVISVLDDLQIGDGSDIGGDFSTQGTATTEKKPALYLYAENITLTGNLKFNQGILSSHAISPAVSTAGIDVSGQAGTETLSSNMNTSPGTSGGNGDDGGSLFLYLESGTANNFNIEINASGGNGGDGQPGTMTTPGGSGGNGGNGGSVDLVLGLDYNLWLSKLQAAYLLSPLSAQQAAIQEIIGLIPTNDENLTNVIACLTNAVNAGNSDDFKTSAEAAAQELSVLSSDYSSSVKEMVNISFGEYGAYGDGDGNPLSIDGKSGNAGSLNIISFGNSADMLTKLSSPFIYTHASQCERLLNVIKLKYFTLDPVNDPDGVTDLLILMLRLQNRTAPFTNAANIDNTSLVQYYASKEGVVGSMNSVDRLNSVNTEVTQYLMQIKLGQDLFGYTTDYVPLGRFTFYQGMLSELMPNFLTIENSYNSYFENLTEANAAIQSAESVRSSRSAMITQLQNQEKELVNLIQQTATVIESYQSVLPPLKQKVSDDMTKFESDIENAFGGNFDTTFQALTSLAFAPESSLMMVTQASQFLYDGATKITNDEGQQVNKAYLINQLKSVSSDINSISEGYSALDNGTLQCDDPAAGKLLAEEQQLTSFFSDYYNSFPDDLNQLQTDLNNYISKITERNSQILTYNAAVIILLNSQQQISEMQDQNYKLNTAELSAYQSDFPDLLTFISSIYYSARKQVMNTLDLTARAYKFWALSDTNIIQTAYQGYTLPELNYTVLEAAQNSILGDYQSAIENFGTNASSFPANDSETGLLVTVPDYQVQLFQQTEGTLMINIPCVTSSTTQDESVFAGMANIRVNTVRAWFEGENLPSSLLIKLIITHTGKETIVNQNDDIYTFKHDPVSKNFNYYPNSTIDEDANFGLDNDSGQTGSNIYAALGPFTTWCISAPANLNPNLNLIDVQKITLEFRGSNLAFS